MQINGLIKTSLVDYPGHLTATLFTPGCNMRCPFCHNSALVLGDESLEQYPESTIYEFLVKRKGILEAICITGGEPTLQQDLLPFLRNVKKLGLKIKLDTNGLNPDVLLSAIDEKLIDFISMDIKNSPEKYTLTSGVNSLSIEQITKSVSLLKSNKIDYEFRTTVVAEFHTYEDFLSIADWLSGSSKYVLQQYKFSPNQLSSQVFKAYSYEQFQTFQNILQKSIAVVELRGF